MNADRRVEEIASPNFLKKVAVIFKSMLTKPTLDDEASAAASWQGNPLQSNLYNSVVASRAPFVQVSR